MSAGKITIGVATPDERAAALDCLFAATFPAAARAEHIAALVAASPGDDPWQGLLVGRSGSRIVGAVWAQLHAGQSCTLWVPRQADDVPADLPRRLLTAAVDGVRRADVRTVQALVAPEARDDAQLLEAGGFERLAELLYLLSVKSDFPSERPTGELSFERYREAEHDRLAAIVDRTYAGSLDCPGLNGLRSATEVLNEYRADEHYRPEQWWFVRQAACDVGCLLLADQAEMDQFELVYMALVPEARGDGRGEQIVREAQWLAACAARSRLVLAVDRANHPAVAMYERAGFVAWERRLVYLLTLAR